MRKAFEWTYQTLDEGRSRRSVISRCKKLGRVGTATKEAFQLFDKLKKFDQTAFPGQTIYGIDEVGRGPLAGPLVAACVELPSPLPLLPFLRDSKKLRSEEREILAKRIESQASQVAYGVVEAVEFGGELNLHHLTFLAMQRALEQMENRGRMPAVLVDGKFPLPSWNGPQAAVVKGDDLSLSIAAASVLAKVYRDRRMAELHATYPVYGFRAHVGYGTEKHREAILEHGPCPEHRSNFIVRILDTGSP